MPFAFGQHWAQLEARSPCEGATTGVMARACAFFMSFALSIFTAAGALGRMAGGYLEIKCLIRTPLNPAEYLSSLLLFASSS